MRPCWDKNNTHTEWINMYVYLYIESRGKFYLEKGKKKKKKEQIGSLKSVCVFEGSCVAFAHKTTLGHRQ